MNLDSINMFKPQITRPPKLSSPVRKMEGLQQAGAPQIKSKNYHIDIIEIQRIIENRLRINFTISKKRKESGNSTNKIRIIITLCRNIFSDEAENNGKKRKESGKIHEIFFLIL